MGKLMKNLNFEPAEPLWKRAPASDAEGRALTDLMMIIPKFRQKPQALIMDTIQKIEVILHKYRDVVTFADLNMRLNVLWISVKPIPGIRLEVSAAIRECVPEALLVQDMTSAGPGGGAWGKKWSSFFKKLLPKKS